MKKGIFSFLIGIWTVGALLISVFPAGAEEKVPAGSIRPVSERDLGSVAVGPEEDVLEFEAGAPERAIPPERQVETLRFHQNTLLERFQNTDAHGQLFLTFSADGIELRLRSLTGAEAPVAGTPLPRE